MAPPRPAIPPRARLAAGAVAALAVVFVALYVLGRSGEVAPQATPAAVHASAVPSAAGAAKTPTTAASPEQPTPQSSLTRLARAVGAFAAPDGQYLGAIEAGRPYTAVARLGAEWTQIDAEGSGKVWIKAAELPPDAALPDLATPTPQPQPTSPPVPQVIVREVPAAPAPTQCASVNGGGVSIERCGTASLDALQAEAQAAWNAQFGGNRVQVATMTPYGGTP